MPIKFGVVVTEMTGKLGGAYTANHRCGARLSHVTTKPKRRSAAQQQQRIKYSQACSAWHLLTASQVAYYNFNAPVGLSGFNYFVSQQFQSVPVWDDNANWDDSQTWSD
jgi:hypothetical protein